MGLWAVVEPRTTTRHSEFSARHAVEFVEFAVRLARAGTETKPGVRVAVASLLNFGASGRSNETCGPKSCIKFRGPVAFPKHSYPEQV